MKKTLLAIVMLIGLIVVNYMTYETVEAYTVSTDDIVKVGSATDSVIKIEGEKVNVNNDKENSLVLIDWTDIETIEIIAEKNVFGFVKYNVVSVK